VAPFHGPFVEALVQRGLLDEARATTDLLAAISDHSREPRGAADLARCRALLATGEGRPNVAAEAWRAATDGYRTIDAPLEVGIALLGLGSALRRAGKRSDAGAALQQASEQFEQLGTPPYLAMVAAELERLGVRRTANALELTPTEQQVAEHVVAGRSNAEIAAAMSVSLRTVESNLTKVYRKLGVRSRTELAAARHAGRTPA
jgi:DNA-binding NarL/FixJ family response regulator